MMPERRQHPRVPYGAWVEDMTEGGLAFHMAQNLSLGGVLLRAKGTRPPLGHRVRLRLLIENERRVMTVEGEVMRHVSEHEGDFAVRFDRLEDAQKQFLRELIREAVAAEPGTGDRV
jgi:hypothetical protein